MTRFACLSLLLLFATTTAIAAAPQPPEFREAYRTYTELSKQGKFGEAIPYAQKALDIALKSDAFDDDARGKLAFNLGYVNLRDYRLSDAISAFTIAIERLEKAKEPDQDLITEALFYRGACYRNLFNDKEAARDLDKVVSRLTGATPAVRIARADALENLAWVTLRQDRPDLARKHAAEAHKIYATLLPARHPRILRVQVLIAAVEYRDGHHVRARDILAAAVAAAEKAGIVPEGATEKTAPDQFTLEELGRFHTDVSHFYALMSRKEDAEYHRKLAAELGRGQRPAVFRVKPVKREPPRYPGRASSDGVVGWALVEYTIRKDGSTADIEIVEAAPEGYFERAVVEAVSAWKFAPPFVDGKPSDVKGVRTMIQFMFENQRLRRPHGRDRTRRLSQGD